MTGDRTGEFVKDVLRESLSAPIGRRTTEQIIARLLRRVGDADDPDVFAAALEVIRNLVSLDGPPGTVVDEARRVASSHGVGGGQFDELEQLMDEIDERGVTLDLGHARALHTTPEWSSTCPTPRPAWDRGCWVEEADTMDWSASWEVERAYLRPVSPVPWSRWWPALGRRLTGRPYVGGLLMPNTPSAQPGRPQ